MLQAERGVDTVANMVASARDDIQTAIIMNRAGKTEQVNTLLRRADNNTQHAIQHLVTVEGATRPGVQVSRDTLRLEQLNTEATREMLAALDALVAAAEKVDRERGWIDGNGEGIGFAEQYGHERLRIATEIYGPKGRE